MQRLWRNATFQTKENSVKRAITDETLQYYYDPTKSDNSIAYGGMGRECQVFYKRLSSMLAEKRDDSYSQVASWIRTKTSFALLRSSLMCLRGTRHHFYRPEISMTTIDLEMREAQIREN